MLRVLLYVIVLAAIIYAVFWAIGRRNDGPGGTSGKQPPTRRGPLGPDDDEDFLRQLDFERRRDAQRKRNENPPGEPGDPPPAPTG